MPSSWAPTAQPPGRPPSNGRPMTPPACTCRCASSVPWTAAPTTSPDSPNPLSATRSNEGAETVLADACAAARKRQSEIEVFTLVSQGAPAAVLCAQAGGAAEIVVGNRGLGGFARAVLGSVSLHVAGQAHGPVVVVRAGSETHHGEIVVGIDDSAGQRGGARLCLRAGGASHQHPARRPRTAAAGVRQHPRIRLRPPNGPPGPEPRRRRPSSIVAGEVPQGAGHRGRSGRPSGGRARRRVEQGRSGRRGVARQRAFGSALLGSVGHGVLHHAACAVAIVRPDLGERLSIQGAAATGSSRTVRWKILFALPDSHGRSCDRVSSCGISRPRTPPSPR